MKSAWTSTLGTNGLVVAFIRRFALCCIPSLASLHKSHEITTLACLSAFRMNGKGSVGPVEERHESSNVQKKEAALTSSHVLPFNFFFWLHRLSPSNITNESSASHHKKNIETK
jgi:hypothetical protein